MIITERNTKKFKDIVNTIIVSKGETVATQRNSKQRYNFNLKGEIKPIKIGGITYDDIISYYWVVDGSSKLPIRYVTYSDYVLFLRDAKITEIVGGGIEIISKVRNVRKTEFSDFTPIVGMLLKYEYTNVIVTKVTPKTFKYKFSNLITNSLWGNKEYSARVSSFDGKWISNERSFSIGQYTREEQSERREYERQEAMWR